MLVLLILINEKEISVTTKKEREAYHRWTPADRFRIGEYAAENGNTAAVRKFDAEFPRLNESTAREFKKKYNIKIVNAAKEKREVSKLVPKYSSQTGRPLLLGDLGSIVQTYIKQLSNRGGVLNRTIANTTTQVLLIHCPSLVGEIGVGSSFWLRAYFEEWFQKTSKNFVSSGHTTFRQRGN